MLAWFINPELARKVFARTERVESTLFYEDLKQHGVDVEKLKEIFDAIDKGYDIARKTKL